MHALLPLCAAVVTQSSDPTPCGSFVSDPRSPGVYMRLDVASNDPACAARLRRAEQGEGGIAGAGCDPIASNLQNPGAIWRDGNLLYVGNNAEETALKVTVIDVTVAGGEFVVGTIATPVNPVDIAVALGRLYVIDQTRNKLYSQPLGGGPWTFIPLPNAVITEWDYGHIIEPFGDRMYVIHQWENKISVVNLVTQTVESTISDLYFLPDRIVFVNDAGVDKMVVLGVGLDAPSCFANGPNFSVFTLPNHTKLYQKSIAGACPMEILARDGNVWVTFNDRIKRYSLADGALQAQLQVLSIGRNAVHRGTDIVAHTIAAEVLLIDPSLSGFTTICDLVPGSQVWLPPLEQLVDMPLADGRVFITNRNNNTVDRVQLDVPCAADLDGDGSVGAGDLAVLLGQWGGPGSADFDASGAVNASDLSVLLGAWGDC
jgi:DNA-binding beta-propeller fold protein YncE